MTRCARRQRCTVTLVHRLSSKDIDRGLAGPGALDDVDAFARWRLSRRAGRGRWHASPTVRAARSMLPPRGPARWEWFRSRQHDRLSADAATDPAGRA